MLSTFQVFITKFFFYLQPLLANKQRKKKVENKQRSTLEIQKTKKKEKTKRENTKEN